MPEYTQDWFSRHISVWRALLDPLFGRPDLRALEVGSFEGCLSDHNRLLGNLQDGFSLLNSVIPCETEKCLCPGQVTE